MKLGPVTSGVKQTLKNTSSTVKLRGGRVMVWGWIAVIDYEGPVIRQLSPTEGWS